MSEVRVNNIVDYGGKGAPTFDNGAVISGVSSLGSQAKIGSNVTITSGGINVSGVTTAATLSGNLTGDVSAGFLTATSTVIGSGVTINAGGLNITGVCTATTFEGDGSSMTGVAMTITPMAYNPDVNDSIVSLATGIGITFDHRILAGSGNITIREDSASGTVVENFGVGSSVTIAGRSVSFTPSSELSEDQVYHISYPSGAFTNTGGDVSYVGTAYTFVTKLTTYSLWGWGNNWYGALGHNDQTRRSSPVQVPGTTWKQVKGSEYVTLATKSDGTLWGWGQNEKGQLAQNSTSTPAYSSPTQIGSGTDWSTDSLRKLTTAGGSDSCGAIKTDGTLWVWGSNSNGQLGQNEHDVHRSSPTQVPGTNWKTINMGQSPCTTFATKTDGTTWAWGHGYWGSLAQNNRITYSSPIQVPGSWDHIMSSKGNGGYTTIGRQTNGTLWSWGYSGSGQFGTNIGGAAYASSPIQIPGTTWSTEFVIGNRNAAAIKTDGTLWTWGLSTRGAIGDNNRTARSSPTQVPGTTWSKVDTIEAYGMRALKTDNTYWTWGENSYGELGQNNRTNYSSPVQVPGTWNRIFQSGISDAFAAKEV